MTTRILLATTAIILAGAATAQDVPENPRCEVKGENGMVTLLLCPAGLSEDALAGEGKAACGDTATCGAWIWTNEADMPAEAPDSHDKLTPEQIVASHGVWMNGLNQLVTIKAEKK